MDKDTIQSLFEQLMPKDHDLDESVQEFFSLLIETTLEYRDQLLASKGIVVTVDDVRTSLKWLVPCLATGNIPHLENQVSLDLLKAWLNQLRTRKIPLS